MDKYGFTGIERLQHILDALNNIELFCEGVTEEQFLADSRIYSSVLYQFIIIGEAIQYVDHEILKKYPYTWHLPRSFRNYFAYEYFGINLKQVFGTVTDVLPGFKDLVKDIIMKEKA